MKPTPIERPSPTKPPVGKPPIVEASERKPLEFAENKSIETSESKPQEAEEVKLAFANKTEAAKALRNILATKGIDHLGQAIENTLERAALVLANPENPLERSNVELATVRDYQEVIGNLLCEAVIGENASDGAIDYMPTLVFYRQENVDHDIKVYEEKLKFAMDVASRVMDPESIIVLIDDERVKVV